MLLKVVPPLHFRAYSKNKNHEILQAFTVDDIRNNKIFRLL